MGKRLYVFYHGSPLEDKGLLLSKGLKKGTFITRSLPRAAIFGGAVFKLKIPKTLVGWSSPGDFILKKSLSPGQISLVKEFKSDIEALEWGEDRWSSFDNDEVLEYPSSLGSLIRWD